MKPLLDQGGVFLYSNEGQKIKVWSKTREYLFPSHISTMLFFCKMTKIMVCDYSWV